MLRSAVSLALVAAAWISALVWWRAAYAAEERRDLVALKLTFPRRLPADAITDFLAATSGLRLPWWKARLYVSPIVCIEALATSAGVSFSIVVNERRRARVEQMLRAHMPQVRYERESAIPIQSDLAATYRLSTSRRELRISPTQLSNSILHSLSPLDPGEQLVLQWVLTPAGVPVPPQVTNKPFQPTRWPLPSTLKPNEVSNASEAAAWRIKQRLPLSHAVLRIGASASSPERQRGLIRRVETTFHPASNPGVQFRRRWLPKRRVARALERRRTPLGHWPVTVNAAELAQLLAWPIEAVDLPGIDLAGCRQLPVPAGVPATGTVIGDGFAHGADRVAAMDLESRVRHLGIIAPTGTGKSTLMANMISHDLAAGFGVFVLDPKDLADDVLARVPSDRHSDVVVLDPSDADRPVGIQPLAIGGRRNEASVEHLVSICRRVFVGDYGIWIDELLRFGLRSLLIDPTSTLIDLIPLYGDPVFRARLVAAQTDPITRSFWDQFNSLSTGEQILRAAPLLSRLRAIFGRPSLRRVFAQPNPSFDLTDHLNRGGVVIASVRPGTLGDEAANLYGSILLGLLWNTIQARAALPADRRRPLMVYLDEFSRYAGLPVPLEAMLALARGYKVGVTVALQYLDQLPTDVRQSVVQNVRSILAFQLNSADARILARELGGVVDADDLQGLAAWEMVARIYGNGATQRACTLRSRNMPPQLGDPERLRDSSASRWGAIGEEVEGFIATRLSPATDESICNDNGDGAVGSARPGRKRRAS